MRDLIGTRFTGRHACGDVHLPNCYNPHSDDTYCVCGEQRWPGKVGTWHSGDLRENGEVVGFDRYFLHAEGCPDRIVPDEYAIEADPGRLTASHPTFDTYDEALRAQGYLRGKGIPAGMIPGWPRILWRANRSPWAHGEPLPDPTHLCGHGDEQPSLLDLIGDTTP